MTAAEKRRERAGGAKSAFSGKACVDAAFHLAAPAPASSARVLARACRGGAGHAADGAEAEFLQRMRRQVKLTEARGDLLQAERRERIELQPRTIGLDHGDGGA